MKKLTCFLMFFLFGTYIYSQKIEGQLIDSLTNQPVEGAIVIVDFSKKQLGIKSDKEGKFNLDLPKGRHAISIRHVGYVPAWIYTNTETPNLGLIIKMKMVENELEQVVVVSKGYDQTVKKPLLGVNQINIKTLQKIPAAFGEVDFLRGLQMLPGVTSVGEAANGVNIRGGTTDQNLILLDDTPIFNPTHMFGLFSAVPPEAISNLELYKGNVPARYGGRAASVLDINLKTPSLSQTKINGGISLISNKLMIETPIIKDKLGVYIAARGAYNDFLLPVFSDKFDSVKTTFSEVVGKIFYKINAKNTITAMGYGSKNYFQTNLLSTLPNVVGRTTFFEHTALNFNLKWVYLINSKLDISTSITNADYDPTIGTIELKNSNKVRLNSGVYQKQLKSSLNFQSDKQKIETGFNITNYTLKPGVLEPGASQSVNRLVLPNEYATEAAVFIDDELSVSPKLAITGGFRYSYFFNKGPLEVRDYDETQTKDEFSIVGSKTYNKGEAIKNYGGIEPRLGLRYSYDDNTSFKLGYNLMRQYLQIVSNTTTPIPTSRWKTSDTHIKPQVSQLFTLGAYKSFSNNIFEASLEGYYRGSQNIIDYKPGAEFLMQAFPETELVQGQSKSYGLEFMLSKKKGNFTGWLNYTYARTQNKVYASAFASEFINNGNWYNANFDRPHSFNLSVDFKADEHNSFSFNLVVSSGRPYSEPVGFVNYQNNYYPFYDDRNNKRMPLYHRLDFSWNIYNPTMKNRDWQGNWVFSIYNLYGRKNPYSIFFESNAGAIKAYKLLIFGTPIVSLAYNFNYAKKSKN